MMRWSQLSMLQLLVAIAVVALLKSLLTCESATSKFPITPVETLRDNFAGAVRQGWSLRELKPPLQRDAIKHYSIAEVSSTIASPDSMSRLNLSLIASHASSSALCSPNR